MFPQSRRLGSCDGLAAIHLLAGRPSSLATHAGSSGGIVVGSLAGGGGLGDVDLIYIPEPSTALLLALALAAWLGGGFRPVRAG
jgi:hypothetical protein